MKKVLFAVAVLVLVGGGAAAYFLYLAPGEPNLAVEGEEQLAEEIDESRRPMFHRLPEMTASSTVNGRLRYLRVAMSVMTREEEIFEELQNSTPIIQNALILLLSGYDFSELESTEGKEAFRLRALEEIQGLIKSGRVESVLLTGFVVQ